MLLPRVFIVFDGHQSVLHGLVDQGVHTGHKEADGAEQSLAVFTQQLLCFCVIAKLVLQSKEKKNIQAFTYILLSHLS